ncbi:MAG: zinc transporter ZupT [Defluviitaleaceae bacterium]|nr:zinc transporter ZupT [Defluviitaleaceae bacterium]MCL2275712.1 zinc transporter ZupT [Defluviitaleaceae bacterium]
MSDALFAFLLTLFAGLATGVGGGVVLFTRVENKKALAVCLSFAAGVMLYISFAEILLKGFEGTWYWLATLAFFGGVGGMALLDRCIPRREDALRRTGNMSALAIAIHNFPEGIITFMAAMYDPALGVAIAVAVAIHNIPEGIAMAAPLYYATGSKKKALLVATLSGLTEPLGGLLAWLALRRVVGDFDGAFGFIFAAVGGIMVFVALHQLLPAAYRYGKHSTIMGWLFAGMGVMAVSLVAMAFVF